MPLGRILRAIILASLGSLVLARAVFTSVELARVKVVESSLEAREGRVRVTTAGFSQAAGLRPPIALIARLNLNRQTAGTSKVSIAVDGSVACERRVAMGGSRRIDCAVTREWRPAIEHEVTIQGPQAGWTLDYFELATHHGHTSGAHYLLILPRSSDRYEKPAAGWIATLWLLLTAILLAPTPTPLPRWIRFSYKVVAGAVVLLLAASLISPWLSDYRVVVAGRTYALWLVLLLAPRLWAFVSWSLQVEKRSRHRWVAVAERSGLVALAPVLVPLVAAGMVVAVGVLRGAFVVDGSDSYGYVSQAHLWTAGQLRIEQPFVRDMKWPLAAETLTPLGYRPASDGMAIVPTYSPGFPMVMAVFEWLGGRDAVFYVVPLLGGLTVWATYLLGSRIGGPAIGLAAMVLMATSPPFLIQLLAPMSDVPAAAWWTLSLACVASGRRSVVLVSGLAAGAAILTRPNLAPLAVIPGGLLLFRAVREGARSGRAAQRFLLFATGVGSACLVIAVINTRLWGSPFLSGYGSFDSQFAWKNLLPNLARYPRWILESQTPAVLLALVAVFVMKSASHAGDGRFRPKAIAIMLSCFVAGVFLSYLFYVPFDDWFWLRFLLPAFPPMLVLMSVVVAALVARVPNGGLAMVTVIGLLAWHGVSYGVRKGVFDVREERRNVAVGEYISGKLPARAVFLSMQQSGSIRYYSGRLTVRWDLIGPDLLDTVLQDLRRLGYSPYFALEAWEEPQFQQRFRGHSAVADLDWPPVARHEHGRKMRIYDPLDGRAPVPEGRTSEIIR